MAKKIFLRRLHEIHGENCVKVFCTNLLNSSSKACAGFEDGVAQGKTQNELIVACKQLRTRNPSGLGRTICESCQRRDNKAYCKTRRKRQKLEQETTSQVEQAASSKICKSCQGKDPCQEHQQLLAATVILLGASSVSEVLHILEELDSAPEWGSFCASRESPTLYCSVCKSEMALGGYIRLDGADNELEPPAVSFMCLLCACERGGRGPRWTLVKDTSAAEMRSLQSFLECHLHLPSACTVKEASSPVQTDTAANTGIEALPAWLDVASLLHGLSEAKLRIVSITGGGSSGKKEAERNKLKEVQQTGSREEVRQVLQDLYDQGWYLSANMEADTGVCSPAVKDAFTAVERLRRETGLQSAFNNKRSPMQSAVLVLFGNGKGKLQGTSFHADRTEALNVPLATQLSDVGQVLSVWAFVSFSASDAAVKYLRKSSLAGKVLSARQLEKMQQHLIKATGNPDAMRVVEQKAGQVMRVPPGEIHQVHNVLPSVKLAFDFLELRNLEHYARTHARVFSRGAATLDAPNDYVGVLSHVVHLASEAGAASLSGRRA